MLHENVHFSQASLYRLGSLTLTTEHSYYYKKMDQFRKACACFCPEEGHGRDSATAEKAPTTSYNTITE